MCWLNGRRTLSLNHGKQVCSEEVQTNETCSEELGQQTRRKHVLLWSRPESVHVRRSWALVLLMGTACNTEKTRGQRDQSRDFLYFLNNFDYYLSVISQQSIIQSVARSSCRHVFKVNENRQKTLLTTGCRCDCAPVCHSHLSTSSESPLYRYLRRDGGAN